MTLCLRRVAFQQTGTFSNRASFMSARRWCGPLLQNGAGTSRDPPRREPSGHDLPGGGQLASGVQMDSQQHRYHSLLPWVQVSASFHLKAFWRWRPASQLFQGYNEREQQRLTVNMKDKKSNINPACSFSSGTSPHIYSLLWQVYKLFKYMTINP